MPKMDGAVFLRNLMKLHPMPAVVISSFSARQSDIFDDGAVGFIEKTKTGESISDFGLRIKDSLLNLTFLLKRYTLKKPKIKNTISNKINSDIIEEKMHPDKLFKSKPALLPGPKVIAIGSSTGGVDSLLQVFKKLPKDLAPILITQHIPYGFSSSFAQRLNTHSLVNVSQANDGDIIQRGHAYLAPGNMHMTLEKKGTSYVIKLLDSFKVSRHKPSVDVMFRSINNTIGSGAMAVIMTGMGDDGSIAMKELYDNNAYTLAQNEESCVVFGMPKVAIEVGAVRDICHLDDIALYITEFSQNKRK